MGTRWGPVVGVAAAAVILLLGATSAGRGKPAEAATSRVPAASPIPASSPSPVPAASPSAASDRAPPLPPVPAKLYFHGPRDRRAVAITFDACEDRHPAGFDQSIYEILVRTRTPATVFLGGRWMEDHPEATRLLAQDPLIELGNHSYVHPHFTRISDQRVLDEVRRTQDIQYHLTGRQGRVFRFPFGDFNQRDVELVASLGLTPIQWEVVSGDPDPHVSARAIVREVLARARPGSVIIFHINGRGVHTAEALPQVIAGLRELGFELVTVSELLGLR